MHHLSLALCAALALVGGCGGDGHASSGTTGSGGAGGCSTTDPGSTGKKIADPQDPCATLEAGGEPRERVALTDKSGDTTVTTPVELMWAWQYAARAADGDPGSYDLEEEFCSQPAGSMESCAEVPLAKLDMACQGPLFGSRFAIDDSQYKPGENVYRISIRMKRGCDVVSSDTFTMHVTFAPPP
jgi:hypothetical protein